MTGTTATAAASAFGQGFYKTTPSQYGTPLMPVLAPNGQPTGTTLIPFACSDPAAFHHFVELGLSGPDECATPLGMAQQGTADSSLMHVAYQITGGARGRFDFLFGSECPGTSPDEPPYQIVTVTHDATHRPLRVYQGAARFLDPEALTAGRFEEAPRYGVCTTEVRCTGDFIRLVAETALTGAIARSLAASLRDDGEVTPLTAMVLARSLSAQLYSDSTTELALQYGGQHSVLTLQSLGSSRTDTDWKAKRGFCEITGTDPVPELYDEGLNTNGRAFRVRYHSLDEEGVFSHRPNVSVVQSVRFGHNCVLPNANTNILERMLDVERMSGFARIKAVIKPTTVARRR